MSRLPLTYTATPHVAEPPLVKMQHGDPLARLISRWRLKPYWVLLITAVYGVLHALALPALFGHLHTAQGITGALED